ncbi:MAG: T9SS type A sorting domain-containing protein [Psychroserpens sp.]|uniref:DUF7619 domain-containing protein n=1 Tax=Psychroserpens sp. TaxID=2020870 RepID=UPI00300157CA
MRALLIVVFILFSYQAFTQDLNMQDGTFNRCAPDLFFDSGGLGGNYSNNENYVSTICPEVSGESITVDFLSFNTQLNVDVLTIYDGDNTSAPIIGSYAGGGGSGPGTVTASQSNPSGCLTFQFVSNETGITAGWEAVISCDVLIVDEIIDFPDISFKNYLLNCYSCMDNDEIGTNYPYSIDTNFDGEVSQQEASQVVRLIVSDKDITSMEGIDYFTSLVDLRVDIGWSGYNNNNDIDHLDLSSNVNLEYLYVNSIVTEDNQWAMSNHPTVGLNTINIDNCTKLRTLKLWYQDLDDLDLSQSTYPDLETINIRTNGLDTIDFGTNEFTSLKNLFLQENNIISPIVLNVPATNNMLTQINFEDSDLPSFEMTVGNYPLLETLNLYNNDISDISSINASTFPLLTHYNVGNNVGIPEAVVTNMPSLVEFDCSNNAISSLDVSNNLNLEILDADFNDISSINLGTISNLTSLRIGINELDELDVSNLSLLRFLGLFDNNLTVLDVSQNTNLKELNVSYNNLTVLDMSQNGSLWELYVTQNQLLYLNLKNGNNLYIDCCEGYCQCVYRFGITGNPDLSYVCIDNTDYTGWSAEILWVTEAIEDAGLVNCVISDECPFIPDGEFYALEGNNKLNTNIDDCLESDSSVPNLKFSIDNSVFNGNYISNQTGSYSIPLIQGEFIITPELENPDYFTVSPSSVTVEFPDQISPMTQDFCITPTDDFNDLEILISPINQAIPGFDTMYKLSYKNVGTNALSGNLSFDFSNSANYMSHLSSIPTENLNVNNVLTWNYSDLAPFEEREILIEFNMNTPTDPNFPLNSGDELNFNASIIHTQTDETPDNNIFNLKQIVVNSLDPNDIRCLEGENILPERAGEYVHYIIRFENVGTTNATNIVIIDYIDETKFDISSLVPLDGGHEFYTRIDEGNQVKFIFDNINLPFDDANNDGYVVFKIKTLDTLVLGDTFSNQAEIYFDFNAPIITNTYTTEVSEEQLSVSDFNTVNTRVYPNPVTNILTIESDTILKAATIYDINGRAILRSKFDNSNHQMNLSALQAGIYFLKVVTNNGSETLKLVKK